MRYFRLILLSLVCLVVMSCRVEQNIVKIGTAANTDKLKITFDGAEELKTIKSNNMFLEDDKSSNGKTFLIIYFDIENISSEKNGINTFTDIELYVDEKKNDGALLKLNKPNSHYENICGLIYVEPEKSSKQCMIFEINENWNKAELYYKEAFNKQAKNFIFEIEKKEIKDRRYKLQYNYLNAEYNIENFGNYNFYFPKSFDIENNANRLTATAEENGKAAALFIMNVKDDEDIVLFEILEKETINGDMQEMFKGLIGDATTFINYEKISSSIDGFVYNFNITSSGINGIAKALCFGDEQTNSWYYVIFIETDNTEYSYTGYFNYFVSTITKVVE